MRPDRTYGQMKDLRDRLITALFLMIEHKNGAFVLGERQQLAVHRLPELLLQELLFGIGIGVRKGFHVVRRSFIPGRKRCHSDGPLFTAAFPLILRDVDDDPVKISRDLRLTTKVIQGAIETQKDLLREVVNLLPVAGQTQQRSKDHGLVLADDLLELGMCLQVR